MCETTEGEWPSAKKMRACTIEKTRDEFKGNRTLYLSEKMEFEPGQFLMAWLPEAGEKPLAIIPNGAKIRVNIEAKGEATKKMAALEKGERLWIRGPYGKGYTTKGVKKAIIVAGGVGTATVIRLAQVLSGQGAKVKTILGGRTKERIIFEKELKKHGEVYITTDDGSYGEKGFNVQILERMLEKEKPDMVYACGPEVMMKSALDKCLAKGIPFEASLERYMKCAIGLCGQCVCGGKLVCKDGPVFKGKELSKLTEFGKTAYLKSGKRVALKEYYEWREK